MSQMANYMNKVLIFFRRSSRACADTGFFFSTRHSRPFGRGCGGGAGGGERQPGVAPLASQCVQASQDGGSVKKTRAQREHSVMFNGLSARLRLGDGALDSWPSVDMYSANLGVK